MELLKKGAVFNKFKHKKSQKRMIWCPASLDRILWGDTNKKKVKGYMMISDITGFSPGCIGSKKIEQSMTLLSLQRTLELEAMDLDTRQSWWFALKLLTGK